jgi:2-haloacid dehalogenase
MTSRPRFITFDCYGTLTDFRMADAATEIIGPRIPPAALPGFIRDFAAYRLDEILGAWKPYGAVIHNAVERACKASALRFDPDEAAQIYGRVPTWGPHPDVPAGLARIAREIPLVILSNASNTQIHDNVAKLGAPFAHVLTAEDAGAYKPRMRAFEFMFDTIGAGPADVLHVSSSFRYDLMTAHDLRIAKRVWVNRGHEPANPFYGYVEVADISGLPAVVGL